MKRPLRKAPRENTTRRAGDFPVGTRLGLDGQRPALTLRWEMHGVIKFIKSAILPAF